ncbi:MAG: hypothetical protein FWC64_07645 [Treponema sp.]|nr:hypothetical protein [Treponema sp.]
MFENFSNVIFIAVALAIFIGRTVAQARKKREAEEEEARNPQQKPAAPRVPPVHFQEKDDDDYVPGYLRKPAAAQGAAGSRTAAKPTKKPSPLAAKAAPALKMDILPEPAPAPAVSVRPWVAASGRREFAFNLNHLSPLKQAVVMAEVLGQPKGMQ